MKSEDRSCILAIETSCDETSAAVVENGERVLSNIVSSHCALHEKYGGVFHEVTSRKHVESITAIIEEAVQTAGIQLRDLSAVAVTQGPGLVGALLVGLMAAKSLALSPNVPRIAVPHIAGHIYAHQLVRPLVYPAVALVVSGGHTELVYMEEEGRFRIIGRTRDDAAGEAYDKVARAMSLPYPGGPHIDRLAQKADKVIELPRAWLEHDSYDFSFSGLKSAVLNLLNQSKMRGEPLIKSHLARGFQESVVEVLSEKAVRAAREFGAKELLVAGGVAANQGLRQTLEKRCREEQIPLRIPPLEYCTDNAAMIAAAAHLKWKRKEFASLDIQARPLLPLEQW